MKKVLLVENKNNDQSTISRFFVESGLRVSMAVDGLSAYEEVVRDHYDLVVAENNLSRMNGLDLLKKIKKVKKSLPVILISANAEVNEAVEAMKFGAHDFIVKPLTLKMIKIIVSQISNGLTVKEKKRPNAKFAIITKDREMNRLLQEAKEIADSLASIFIQGESGTGKELFARHIHHNSSRRNRAFVPINCAALPENLLESELFGHEKGSFTGAITKKLGKFEIANHGTILLDEISEMDIQLQSKLLRVLQEKEIDKVGGISPVPIDVRVIATTNRDIENMIEEGSFREDLYYRLNVIPFHLPPLRRRRNDIPLLANYFIEKYNRIDKRSVKELTEEAVQLLMQKQWRGNVRELENVMERAILMCKGDLIDKDGLFITERDRQPENTGGTFMHTISLREMEKKAIFHTLDQTNGNRTHAAEILGISVRTLRNKLNEYRNKMEAQGA